MSALDSLDFAPLLITEVFESMKAAGGWFDLSKAKYNGDPLVPYVARSSENNAIATFLPHQGFDAPNLGNAITIGVSTSTVFYQPVPFYTSKEIQVLRHPRLSNENGPILVALLREQMSKFQWGNGASLDRLKATRIMVPVICDSDGKTVVDWDGMTRLGKELLTTALERSRRARRLTAMVADALPELRYEPMYVIDIPSRQKGLFRAHKGKRLITAHRKRGTTPFVAGSRVNNSIVDYSDVEPMFPGGWLTLIYNGDGGTGHAKYQPVPFSASDDVIALEPTSDHAAEDALLFVVSLLTHQCVPKFGFGYKLTLHRLGRQKIMVPVTADVEGGTAIDWSGMAAYVRALRLRAERAMCEVLDPVSP